MAAAGHTEQAAAVATEAETVARSITNPERRASALSALARALAATGHAEQAESVASSISNPYWQASALSDLAQALTTAGETPRARKLAAVACQAGRWHEIAAPILRLDSLAAESVFGLALIAGRPAESSNQLPAE